MNNKKTEYFSFDADTFNCIFYNKETGEAFHFDSNTNSEDVINQTFILSKTVISEGESKANSMSNITENYNYCKDFRGNGVYLRKLLKPQEQVLLRFLADYMCYNDCVLRLHGSALGQVLSISQLAEMYEMDISNFRKLLARLQEKQCIVCHERNTIHDKDGNLISDNCITVNPFIYTRGLGVKQEIVSLYSNTVWARLPKSHKRDW